MRKLVILAGPSASGKTEFVIENRLLPYTLSLDNFRLLMDVPQMTETGYEISQRENKAVYEQFYDILEQRMKRGSFTVVDGVHITDRDFARYKNLCKTYRYKMIVVPFRTPLEKLIEYNHQRDFNNIPDDKIERQKKQFDELKISFGTIVEPENFNNYIKFYPTNLSEYKAIHHIGDIHGCFSVLSNILPLKDDEFYIFLGDYFDRGIENAEMARWLLDNYKKPNTAFLKGNHELHLDDYLAGNEIKSSEFEKTLSEFSAAKIKKKELNAFSNSLLHVFLYSYDDKTVFCSHGGTSFFPENINFINPIQFVRGVGSFSTEIDEIFTAPENTYQVHGHRNITRRPIMAGKQSFNLTDEIEFGGYLRVLTLTKENGFVAEKYKNTIFSKRDINADKTVFETLSDDDDINVKTYGNISSLNFSRNAFYKKNWNERTLMARGLFVNNKNYNVVCRGYEKFFNVNEVESTNIESLKNLNFPVTAYVKENGYLGLLGVDESTESLVFASKSSIESDYAKKFEEIVRASISSEDLNKLRLELLLRNTCLVFEVIDPEFDPHIIEYQEKHVVLLDIVNRGFEFKKQTYGQVASFAKRYGFQYKRKAKTLNSYDALLSFIDSVNDYNFTFNNERIEGFVLEDENGFQFKVKCDYYNFWKIIRRLVFENGNKNKIFALVNEEKQQMIEKILHADTAGKTLFEIRKEYENNIDKI